MKLKTMGRDAVMIGHETIDLRYVEQLVDSEQLNTLGRSYVSWKRRYLMAGRHLDRP